MTKHLPTHPCIRFLKEEAKDTLKAHKQGNTSCCDVLRHLSQFKGKSTDDILKTTVVLQEVQFALAMAYGFKDWPTLRGHAIAHGSEPEAGDEEAQEILADMVYGNGKWEDDGTDRVAIFHGGPSTTLVSNRTWDGDALVVEILARAEVESKWGLHIQCQLNPYSSRDAMIKANATEAIFPVRCGRREKYIWSSISFNKLGGLWSRDVNIVPKWGSFNGKADKWYRIRAERIRNMLRLWVDGVPVSELRDDRPIPGQLYVWIQSVCSNVRFRSVRTYRPSAAYITKYAKPVRIFDPYAQREAILARHKGKVVKTAEITLGPDNTGNGIEEILKGEGSPETNVAGKDCRRTDFNTDQWGLSFRLTNPESWDTRNEISLEFEYLDQGSGDIAAFYQTWHYHETPTPDHSLTDTGEWKTCSYLLRDAHFSALQEEQSHFWVSVMRAHGNDLRIHSVKLVEIEKPRVAYEELVQTYENEIANRQGEWSVSHYMFHIALTLIRHLGERKRGEQMLRDMAVKYPDSECVVTCEMMRQRGVL